LVARPSGNPAESEIAICHPIAAVAGVNQQSMHKFRAARRHLIHREIHRESYFLTIVPATHGALRRRRHGTFRSPDLLIAEGSAARTQA
jgi:hypothetical protein